MPRPSTEGARTITYRPITNEAKLIYFDWVAANRRKVDELSGGRIGYLHVPDMGADGIREFIKWYYPQIQQGGADRRRPRQRRRQRVAHADRAAAASLLGAQFEPHRRRARCCIPTALSSGPMVTLLDGNSASDGDIFPAMFRDAGLGPLIGKRSWGGVVGITDHGQLIDGGNVNVPEFGFANAKGEWIIEGHGVDPDIEVENDPASVIRAKTRSWSAASPNS